MTINKKYVLSVNTRTHLIKPVQKTDRLSPARKLVLLPICTDKAQKYLTETFVQVHRQVKNILTAEEPLREKALATLKELVANLPTEVVSENPEVSNDVVYFEVSVNHINLHLLELNLIELVELRGALKGLCVLLSTRSPERTALIEPLVRTYLAHLDERIHWLELLFVVIEDQEIHDSVVSLETALREMETGFRHAESIWYSH